MLTTRKKDFIEFMMSADVLRFGEFQTKSGRLTPYFINTGNYKTGGQIAALGRFYAALIHETCGDRFDAMFGPAYKGIPLATAAAAALATEYGVAKLSGLSLRERAQAMIAIAHPSFRDELAKYAQENFR